MANERIPFIKQYCWQMLLSIGYRFQQRLTTRFIQKMNRIEDDDEFYQVETNRAHALNSRSLTDGLLLVGIAAYLASIE